MAENNLSKTVRERILERYEATGEEHEVRTTPIASVQQFVARIVDAANGAAFAVFEPQELVFFGAGLGDRVEFGDGTDKATEADTNLQKKNSTDGAREMAIEGLSFSSVGHVVKYFADTAPVVGFGVAPTDPAVLRALRGHAVICDPFGVVAPPQLQSPYLLEEAIFQALCKHSTITMELDTSRPFKMGAADLCPASAGSSFLRGSVGGGSYYRFEEGIEWRRDGEPDSDLSVRVKLHREVVVPVSLVRFPGGNADAVPTNVYLRAALRLHGMSVSPLGKN